MRWIQRRPPFTRTATAFRSGSKNVPDSAIFKPYSLTPSSTVRTSLEQVNRRFRRAESNGVVRLAVRPLVLEAEAKTFPVEILKISKIGEIAVKNLNISMSSCVNRNLFLRNSSPQSPAKCIPYTRLEQTAPSLIAGQLKCWKSAKSAKLGWKSSTTSSVRVRFPICFDGIQALIPY